MVHDGNNEVLYEGTDTDAAKLISTTPAASQTVPLGSTACLNLGNRPDRNRSFDGWIDDFRFYTGAGDLRRKGAPPGRQPAAKACCHRRGGKHRPLIPDPNGFDPSGPAQNRVGPSGLGIDGECVWQWRGAKGDEFRQRQPRLLRPMNLSRHGV